MYFKNWFQENFEYPYPSANWKRDLDDYGDNKRGNTFSPENSDENWKAAANEYAEELSLPKVVVSFWMIIILVVDILIIIVVVVGEKRRFVWIVLIKVVGVPDVLDMDLGILSLHIFIL
jgi:hypothetical protein